MRFPNIRRNLQAMILACVVSTGSIQITVAQSIPVQVATAQASRVMNDRRPLNSLSLAQLRKQRLILKAYLKADRKRSQFRTNVKARMNLMTLRIRKIRGVRPVQPKQPAAVIPAVLKDARPSRSLNTPQLRQRIKALKKVISFPGIPRQLRQKARNMRVADVAELKRRNSAVNNNAGSSRSQILAVLNDDRPSSSLSIAQLRQRISRYEQVINLSGAKKRKRKKATRRRARDLAELKRRNTVVRPPVVPAALANPRPARNLSVPQLNRRITKMEKLMAMATLPARYRQKARTLRNGAVIELKRRNSAANRNSGSSRSQILAVLNDDRPSSSLSIPQLRQRILRYEQVITLPGAKKRKRQKATRRRARDVAEMKRRMAAKTPAKTNPGLALLQDRRPATSLKGLELRSRIAKLRFQLGNRANTRKVRKELSRKLAIDRTELRRRVAARRAKNNGQKFEPSQRGKIKLSDQARNLLRDRRRSRDLNGRQLRRRIISARSVLKFVTLNARQRASITDMLRADRAEKRNRLLAARDRRRDKIRRLKAKGQLNIFINPGVVPGPDYQPLPQGDIAAAEADDETIQRQFLRPEKRTYDRRYSREEIVRRPDLTRGFAGIDVDTIKFGFNEYWIREEEVDELDQIGMTLERILAARPYEVFQIEGHTDAVGSDAYNLRLSQQRAQAVKEALVKFFVIPPRALVTVGLGERYLKIPTPDAEQENRRVTIRRITDVIRR